MKQLTRRDFLRLSAAGAAGMAAMGILAGCSTGNTGTTGGTTGGTATGTTGTTNTPVVENQPSSESQVTNAQNVTVAMAVPIDPASLAPYGESNTGRAITLLEVYEQLFAYSEFGKEMLPWVASGYEWVGDDAMTIHVTLKDNVYDQAGNPYTADDVKFFYTAYEQAGYSSTTKYIDGGSAGITVIDDLNVEFKMKRKDATVFYTTFNNSFVFTQAAYEASSDAFALSPVSTSQYKFSDYIGGAEYTIVKDENYWDKDTAPEQRHPYAVGNAEKVIYKIITDTAQTAIALETDIIDIASTVAAAEISNFMNDDGTAKPGYTVASMNTNPSYYVCFNASENSILKDVKLRQAICWAIDNQEVVDIALEGNGDPSVTLGGNMYAGVSDSMREAAKSNYYSCDIEKAKSLLAEAGYPDGINVVIMVSAEDAVSKAGQIIQLQLERANIHAELAQYDAALYNTYKTDKNSGWDLSVCIRGNSSGYVQAVWNGLLSSSYCADGNCAFVVDEEAYEGNQYLLMVENATDENVLKFYNEQLIPKCYFYGLFTMKNFYAAKDSITNIRIASVGNVMPSACGFADDYVSVTEK